MTHHSCHNEKDLLNFNLDDDICGDHDEHADLYCDVDFRDNEPMIKFKGNNFHLKSENWYKI